MDMVMAELTPLLPSLQLAVAAGDVDGVNESLNNLELSFMRAGECELGKLFEPMMELLDMSKNSGDVAWQVFTWMLSMVEKFDTNQVRALQRYVVDSYSIFGSDLLVNEAAEWVGGWRDRDAINAVRTWIEAWETLSADARRGVRSALAEIVDGSANEIGADDLRVAQGLQSHCECLMREDRLWRDTGADGD